MVVELGHGNEKTLNFGIAGEREGLREHNCTVAHECASEHALARVIGLVL